MKNKYVAVLDFGSSKITCMAATKVAETGEFLIRAVGQSAYNGFDDNNWYEPETIRGAIKDAITQVENKLNTTFKEMYVGVPGVFCAVATGEASLTFHSKKKVDKEDVAEIIKKADFFQTAPELIPLGGKPVYFVLDGAIKTYEPVGNIASKLTGLVSFSFMKSTFRNSVAPILMEKGVSQIVYVNACEAQATFVTQSMFGTVGHAIVIDIGHITTNVTLCGGNGVLFGKTFGLGSGYLASDLCQVIGCDFNFAMSILEKVNLNLEIQEGDAYSINGRMVDAKRTNEVIKARIGQIADYIIKCFNYYNTPIPNNTPIVLTGGGLTYLRGGADCMASYLGKQIRTYESVNPQTRRNEYASTYGLLAEAVKENKRRGGVFSLLKRKLKEINNGLRK